MNLDISDLQRILNQKFVVCVHLIVVEFRKVLGKVIYEEGVLLLYGVWQQLSDGLLDVQGVGLVDLDFEQGFEVAELLLGRCAAGFFQALYVLVFQHLNWSHRGLLMLAWFLNEIAWWSYRVGLLCWGWLLLVCLIELSGILGFVSCWKPG